MEQGVLGTRGHAEEGALPGRVAIMGEASVVLDEKEQSQTVMHQRQTACFIPVPQKQSAQVGQWSPQTHPEKGGEDQKEQGLRS